MRKIIKYAWMIAWLGVIIYVWYNYFGGNFMTTFDQENIKSPYGLYIFIWATLLFTIDIILMYISTPRKKLKLSIYNLLVILYLFYFFIDNQSIRNRDISIFYTVVSFFLTLFGIFSPKKLWNSVSDIVESKWSYSKKVEIIEV